MRVLLLPLVAVGVIFFVHTNEPTKIRCETHLSAAWPPK